MKVLLLTTHLNIGGITSHLLSLAQGLLKEGVQVIVASSGGSCRADFEKGGVRHFLIPIRTKSELSPRTILSYLKLRKFLRHEEISLIHAHTRVTQVLASWLSRSLNVPYLSTFHGFFPPRWHRRRFPCRGEKIIAVSNGIAQHVAMKFHFPKEDMATIFPGIGLPEKFQPKRVDEILRSAQDDKEGTRNDLSFRACRARNLSAQNNPPPLRLGTLCRLTAVKGVDLAIGAMAQVIRDFPHAELLIAGDGEERKKLADLTVRLKLQNHVKFLGSVADREWFFQHIDIFLSPHLWEEPFGLSVVEAMSHGTLVIASNRGGSTEIISHGVSGLLISPDSQKMAAAIIEILTKPHLFYSMPREARQTVKNRFSLETMTAATLSLYKEIVR